MKNLFLFLALGTLSGGLYAMTPKYITCVENKQRSASVIGFFLLPEISEEHDAKEIVQVPIRGRLISLPCGESHWLYESIALDEDVAPETVLIATKNTYSILGQEELKRLAYTAKLSITHKGTLEHSKTAQSFIRNPISPHNIPSVVIPQLHEDTKCITIVENRSYTALNCIIIPFADPQEELPFGMACELDVEGYFLSLPACSNVKLESKIQLPATSCSTGFLLLSSQGVYYYDRRHISNLGMNSKLSIPAKGKPVIETIGKIPLRYSPLDRASVLNAE